MPVLRPLAALEAAGPEESIEILSQFQMRSSVRETETDKARFESILKAIDDAREAAAAEREGLVRRIKAIVLRTKDGSARQRAFQPNRHSGSVLHELSHAEARLAGLSEQIKRLEGVREQVAEITITLVERRRIHEERTGQAPGSGDPFARARV